MKNIFLVLLVIIIPIIGMAQDLKTFHDNLDSFLGKHVINGKVDYNGIQKYPIDLNRLVTMSQTIVVEKNDMRKYQAFWINAYNLHVIKGLIDNYPINSPLEKAGFFDKIEYTIAGQKVTLNYIENELLRSNFKDARFHFVLVCGALGCPPLIAQSFRPETLELQLEQQTKLSINNDEFIKPGKKVAISQIFEWYKEDFEVTGKTIDFINKYREEPFPSKTKIKYYPYNWKINKQ